MDVPNTDLALAGSLEDLKAKGRLVLHGAHRPVLVVFDRGRVFALDNRCPHMGFPLERGSVEDGILTCHWHHARFDLESGCTFDLWADDAPTFPVEVRNGEVWVKTLIETRIPPLTGVSGLRAASRTTLGWSSPRLCMVSKPPASRTTISCDRRRCSGRGTATDGGSVLRSSRRSPISCPPCRTRRLISLFSTARAEWRRTARDSRRGASARPSKVGPSQTRSSAGSAVGQIVRHREAAERTLLTAIAPGLSPPMLADALLAAVTERAFADTGHSLDFINKAFECLNRIGWEHASALLPTVVGQMVAARGAEESTEWRQRIDLVTLCDEAAGEMPVLFAAGHGVRDRSDHSALAGELLGDDPHGIIDAIKAAIGAGAAPSDLSRSLAYAAALRVARFGNANEHGDWQTAHHVFTYANALDRMLLRIGEAGGDGYAAAGRGILHGAMALYLTRYLNVPPARIPGDGAEPLDDLPAEAETIRAALLDAFDRQRQVDLAARHTAPCAFT